MKIDDESIQVYKCKKEDDVYFWKHRNIHISFGDDEFFFDHLSGKIKTKTEKKCFLHKTGVIKKGNNEEISNREGKGGIQM